MISNYDKTLLWSGAQTSSCNLSEPLSAFERYQICYADQYLAESMTDKDKTCQRINRAGHWSTQGYMIWPANVVISNGTKTVTCNRFQMLGQYGTEANCRLLGSTGNSASNVKWITSVWGINRKNKTDSSGIGSPGEGWKQYNESLLWSGNDWQDNINLSEPASGFERLKVMVGSGTSGNESINYHDVAAPIVETARMSLYDFWGNSTASYWLGLHTLSFYNGTQSLSATDMKLFQLGTGTNNSFNTTGSTAIPTANAGWRNPIRQIWGINRKV